MNPRQLPRLITKKNYHTLIGIVRAAEDAAKLMNQDVHVYFGIPWCHAEDYKNITGDSWADFFSFLDRMKYSYDVLLYAGNIEQKNTLFSTLDQSGRVKKIDAWRAEDDIKKRREHAEAVLDKYLNANADKKREFISSVQTDELNLGLRRDVKIPEVSNDNYKDSFFYKEAIDTLIHFERLPVAAQSSDQKTPKRKTIWIYPGELASHTIKFLIDPTIVEVLGYDSSSFVHYIPKTEPLAVDKSKRKSGELAPPQSRGATLPQLQEQQPLGAPLHQSPLEQIGYVGRNGIAPPLEDADYNNGFLVELRLRLQRNEITVEAATGLLLCFQRELRAVQMRALKEESEYLALQKLLSDSRHGVPGDHQDQGLQQTAVYSNPMKAAMTLHGLNTPQTPPFSVLSGKSRLGDDVLDNRQRHPTQVFNR